MGRISGEYSPADPCLFKQKRKQRYPFSHDNSTNNDYKFLKSSTYASSSVQGKKILGRAMNENKHKTAYDDSDTIRQQLHRTSHGTQSDDLPHLESLDRLSSKFDVIKRLWRQHLPLQNLDEVLRGLALRVIEDGGDDSILDKFLGELNKKVNLLKAFDQLSFSNAPTPSADGFSQNQRIQQESAHNPTFRQIPEAASLKLAEIEQVLKPHCPLHLCRT